MAKNTKAPFDLQGFLANVTGERTVFAYQNSQIIFSQGEPADSIFYIQEGQVKLTVLSEQGKEASLQSLDPAISAARDAWLGSPGAWRQPRQWTTARSCGWRRQP